MLKLLILIVAVIVIVGIGCPTASCAVAGKADEATRLVDAADRTQNKAQSLGSSYSELIPPKVTEPAEEYQTGDPGSQDVGDFRSRIPVTDREPAATGDGDARLSGSGGYGQQDAQLSHAQDSGPATPVDEAESLMDRIRSWIPGLGSGDAHEVQDALDSLNAAQQVTGQGNTEYLKAVNKLKDAWEPRYKEATEEFDRYKRRLEYANDVSQEYLNTQERLTAEIIDPQLRARLEQTDDAERDLIFEWVTHAHEILWQAEDIKANLDDMNIQITKLELSATFASLYESFAEVPLALTTLNEELEAFEQETERIYQTFGPRAGQ